MRYPSPAFSRLALVAVLASCAVPAVARATKLRSISLLTPSRTGTASADGGSAPVAVTPDGRYVVFTSTATDLTDPGATGAPAVYRRDVRTGQTKPVGAGDHPAISDDGRYVTWESLATDLVGGFTDTNGPAASDVYVRDMAGGVTRLVSHAAGAATTGGAPSSSGPVISGDGAVIVYRADGSAPVTDLVPVPADGNTVPDLLAYDVATRANALVTANASATGTQPGTPGRYAISTNDRYVVYVTDAAPSSVVAGLADGNGAGGDVFRRDLTDGATDPVSVGATPGTTGNATSDATEPPAISDDGRFVAFASQASDLTAAPDANGALDVFVRDMGAGRSVLASSTPDGAAGNAGSHGVVLSADGRHVAFVSQATDLAAGVSDTAGDDVFFRDIAAPAPVLLSASADRARAQGGSDPSISDDGRYVAFASTGTNLIAGLNDTNSVTSDVFLRDATAATLQLVSSVPTSLTTTPDGASTHPLLSGDGRSVVFASQAGNLVAPFADGNAGGDDVYVRGIKLDPAAAIEADPVSGTAPLSVALEGVSPNPTMILDDSWDFGDGTQDHGAATTHTYTAAGDYTVTLRIVDVDGDVATATRAISVIAPPVTPAPVVIPPDRTPPRLTLSAARKQRLATVLRHGLRGGIGTNEDCSAVLTATIPAAAARRLGLGARAVTAGTARLPVAGRVSTGYTLRLTARVRRKLATHKRVRTIPVTLTAAGTDRAGNAAKPVRRAIELRR